MKERGHNPSLGRASAEQVRLEEAMKMVKSGDQDGARQAFEEICTENNDCELGWLWLASLVPDAETGRECLMEVLRINPTNKTALAWLVKSQAPAEPARPRPNLKCPLCRTSWTAPMRECHSCRAVFDLTDMAAIMANDRVNRKVMESALERLREPGAALPFEREFYQAVALFNLLRTHEALHHLDRATQIRSGDERLAHGAIGKQWKSRGRVVVADDSATVREVVARTIEKAGYTTLTAANGLEALALSKETAPDLVILDIAMPGMDGYRVCKAIRSNGPTKSTPVIFITTRDSVFDRAKARMAGVNEYLAKPFEPGELSRLAVRLIADKRKDGR